MLELEIAISEGDLMKLFFIFPHWGSIYHHTAELNTVSGCLLRQRLLSHVLSPLVTQKSSPSTVMENLVTRPSNTFQFFLWNPEVFPVQMRYIILSVITGCTLDARTTLTGSFHHEGVAALVQALSSCLSPVTLCRKLISAACISCVFHSFATQS